MSRKSRGNLKKEDETAIRDNYVRFQEELEPGYVSSFLFQEGIFDKDDLEDIQICGTRKLKATKLLDKLLTAGPHDAFERFIVALEKEQKHLVHRLKRSALVRARNARSPSPQSMPRTTAEKMKDPLLVRLSAEVEDLKRDNEKLVKENVKLTQTIALLVMEKAKLMQSFNDRRWTPGGNYFNEKDDDDGSKRCKVCNSGVYRRQNLQLKSDVDEAIESLLHTISINPKDSSWQGFLTFSAYCNFEKTVQSLLEKQCDANVSASFRSNILVTKDGRTQETLPYKCKMTPLMAAASNGSLQSLKLLLKYGADVNARDELGDNALIHCCRAASNANIMSRECFECFRALLTNETHIDIKGAEGMTAIMHAATNGNVKILESFHWKLANCYLTCNKGRTALMYACFYHGNSIYSCIEYLVPLSDINAQDNDGNTALHHSIQCGNDKAFNQLLSTTDNIIQNIQNNEGKTPLMLAIELDKMEMFEKIIECNPDVNLRDKHGNTALILAMNSREEKYASDLISKAGTDLNAQNNERETALMIASSKRDEGLVNLLIDHGADVNLRDMKGKTALNFIRNQITDTISIKDTDIAKRLVAAGAFD